MSAWANLLWNGKTTTIILLQWFTLGVRGSMRRGFLFIGLWVAVGMFGFGCAGEDAPPVNPSPDPDVVALDASELSHDVGSAGDVTWHGGVAQVFKTRCGDCHTEGGAAPFPLDEYESARAYAEAALASVHSGAMPPWPPSMNCRPIKHAREISEPEAEWTETGAGGGELRGGGGEVEWCENWPEV